MYDTSAYWQTQLMQWGPKILIAILIIVATWIVARAVKQSAAFGPALWPRVTRWDAEKMDAAFDAIGAQVLAIQSTTRNAQLQRAMLKVGDTSPWLDFLKSRNARVEIVPNVGHFTMLEAPKAVNRLIAGFAQKL